MVFTQLEFPIFFALVVLLAWLCRRRTTRNAVLLVASYYFYAYWDVRFCGLLVFSTLVDFFVAQRIDATDDHVRRRRLLMVSLTANLGVLGFFKYFNFFIDSARPLLDTFGLGTQTLSIILPVGISFYTFQTLSYTIDVYRGVLRPVPRIVDFALYVAFFPQLVAGPIVRARELLPQLTEVPSFSKRQFYGGAQQMLRGAVKKVLIADRLGQAVDVVFAGPELYSGATLWIIVIAYAGQIYYDFSGYSDIAIGAAKMMGYRFPINFRHPYLATSIADFWRRWHITLSRWLRDYLYISLGGNRVGNLRTYRNLMITMTLGGLWHGAAWTFVLWGVWHGLALCTERMYRSARMYRRARMYPGADLPRVPQAVGRLFTAMVVLIGWVLFRSDGLDTAGTIYTRMLTWSDGIHWFPPLVLLALACMALEHLAWTTRLRWAMRLPATRWYAPIGTAIMLWCLALYAPQDFRPFVYFQF